MSSKRKASVFGLLLVGLMFVPALQAAPESAIQSVLEASLAVVGVRAEGAAFAGGDKPQGIVDPGTGQTVIVNSITPIYFKKTGAGVIIDPGGMIVTNAHIVVQGGRITVTLSNGFEIQGKLVHIVPEQDLAFIRVAVPIPLPYLPFSDSDSLEIGHKAYTIGNSTFVKGSLNGGEISGIGRHRDEKTPGGNRTAILQINFSLYRGDSGCPVMDERGHLIGLVAAAQVTKPDVTFAIPSNIIREIYEEYVRLNGPLEQIPLARTRIS